ncbi:MarR family winged helix-turn-helix transcriptional regulator [Microbacterium hydrocarbonoxydans]|jgi:DNA-binding MarR family transcriptional regulator|uniref:MarR family winged helix-turn-helix transcriptional regulator n=1 Tax=Microbacterium hydrocarbonoxydans TaxID=273678 RepID=UPI003D994764
MNEQSRSARKLQEPDIGILAARVLHRFQRTMFRRLADEDFDDLRPQHGAVLAHLDEEGSRAVDLSQRSGAHKQVVSKLVEELELLGYVTRQPDPADRRAKLIVPTERGLRQMRRSDEIAAGIEAEFRDLIGSEPFTILKSDLQRLVARAAEPGTAGEASRGTR